MKNNEMKPPEKDPFLQRAIEHWLDSANELGYQPLFCEWLITQGYILKYSIKNTNFEQGKDVVAVAQNGELHAYQLKGGSINLKRWREEVKPEIEALIDCPIQHPDIDKSKPHVSYLVTNGEIEDSVRVEIVSLNEKKWKATPLRVWTRGDLLNGFQSIAEGILPSDAMTYKELTDLMFADGAGSPDIPKINSFFYKILKVEEASRAKEQRKRDIAAGILYAMMIAGPFRKTGNHASAVRVMVLLLSLVFYLVDKYVLEEKYWIKSHEIIWGDILVTAKLLEAEVNTNGFDSIFTSPLDNSLNQFRKNSAVTIIYPLKLSQCVSGNEEWKTIFAPELALKYKGSVTIWGEASLLPLIFLALIFKNMKGEKGEVANFSKGAILQILNYNGRKSKHPTGLIPPYYDLDFVVKMSFGMLDEEFKGNYKLSSYYLKPLIEIMVRLGQREFMAENWREISFMRFEEFTPENPIDYYLWRAEKGESLTVIPKKEKSWRELETEANSFDGKTLPPTMQRFPEFLPFFLSAFPFRANSATLGFLDKKSKRD